MKIENAEDAAFILTELGKLKSITSGVSKGIKNEEGYLSIFEDAVDKLDDFDDGKEILKRTIDYIVEQCGERMNVLLKQLEEL